MSRCALITGASGFVGQHLYYQLKENGWEVFGCDVVPKGDVIPCDIGNEEQVRKLLSDLPRLTHVFFLSAVTFVPQSIQDPRDCFRINTDGVVMFTELLRKIHDKNVKFIFISTSEVYGPPAYLPIDEKHPLNPQNPYAISKASSDLYCQYLAKQDLLFTIIARPFNHSGAGQNDRFVLSNFAKQFVEIKKGLKKPILHVGNIKVARDFLHVEDVVRAYELLALHGRNGEAYNICSGKPSPLETFISFLESTSPVKIDIVVEDSRIRNNDVPMVYGSYEKIERETGWKPKKNTEQILEDLLYFWSEQI